MDDDIPWLSNLPSEWQVAVDRPLYFRQYLEYEMQAERTVGYDQDDRPCYISHHYTLTRQAADCDGEFVEQNTYSEEMAAWRLRDERWLIFRTTSTNPNYAPRGFYVLSPDMPR